MILQMLVGLLIAIALFPAPAQLKANGIGPYGPFVDFEKDYASPTITAIAPFNFMSGRLPRIHVHIQYRSIQYVCSSKDGKKIKEAGLQVGTKVEIRDEGKYVQIRGTGKKRWLRLALIEKGELHNL